MTSPRSGPETWLSRTLLAGLVAAGVCGPSPVRASSTHRWARARAWVGGEPEFRKLSDAGGLTDHPIFALAQDSTGFLWIGGVGGLFRYDGQEFTHWAAHTVRSWVGSVAVSRAGTVVAASDVDGAFRVTSGGAVPLPAPPGGWGGPGASVAFDGAGGLWLVHGDVLSHRSGAGPSGSWTDVDPVSLGGERPRRVRGRGADRGVLLITDGGVWTLSASGAPRKLWTGRRAVDVAPGGPFGLLILLSTGRLLSLGDDGLHELLSPGDTPPARAVAVVERAGTAWVALDRYLAAVHSDGRKEVFGPADGVESGGPMLVDREGSLWLGSFQGLFQYPEPRTRRWSDLQGLPSGQVRFLARSDTTLAVVTWQGLGFLRRHGPGGWRASDGHRAVRDFPCPLADGSILLGSDHGLLVVHDASVVARLRAAPVLNDCVPAADGGRWLATSRGLLHLAPGAPRSRRPPRGEGEERAPGIRAVGQLPFARPAIRTLAVDPAARLWIARGLRVCRTAERSLLSATHRAWSCSSLPRSAVEVTSLAALPDGSVWASSSRRGVFRMSAGHWDRIAGSDRLPTGSVLRLVPAGSGGLWVLGHGFVWRVRDRPDLAAGWRVAEKLTTWHGVGGVGADDVLPDRDGGLWIATDRGVVHVPEAVRRLRPAAPPVVLVAARADGRTLGGKRVVDLPHGHNELELRFAALSYRDPSLLRYEVRLAPNGTWSRVQGQPSFRWLNLRPGTYRARVRASLDGTHWSVSGTDVRFRVDPPWYREPEALALGALLAVLLVWAAYRARVGYLVGLERQRTRIAMDLHDEVGSGLASVSILSGVLAADGLAPEEVRSAANEIAGTASELGASLSDIVWSLQPKAITLEGLATRLVEQGSRLFGEGDTAFRADLPDRWPGGSLALPLLRTVLLVGLEALHNASSHARAQRVTLGLAPVGDAWLLEVKDDGVGMADEHPPEGTPGHGLAGMRRRAAHVGAELEVRSAPGRGTSVRLRFSLRDRPAGFLTRPFRALRRRLRRAERPPLA